MRKTGWGRGDRTIRFYLSSFEGLRYGAHLVCQQENQNLLCLHNQICRKKKERNTSHNDAAIGGRRMKQAYGASVRRDWHEKPEVLWEKRVPVPLLHGRPYTCWKTRPPEDSFSITRPGDISHYTALQFYQLTEIFSYRNPYDVTCATIIF